MPLSAQLANADLSVTKDDGSSKSYPLMLDPVTGGLLVRAVGAGGGAADSTYAMQTKQQATLESMDGKLPALVNGAIPITDVTLDVSSSASLSATGVAGTVSSGAVKIDTQGSYTAIVELTGTWSATVSFYETINGTTFNPIKGTLSSGGGAVASTTTNGQYIFNCGGFKEIWVVVTAYTSGTISAALASSIAQQGVNATIFGSSAEGIAPSYPPVFVAGKDAGGLKRALLTDATGILQAGIGSLAGVSLATGDYLPITPSVPAILSYPSSQTFTGTGTSQFQIEAGATYCVTVTNAPTSTASLAATIGFQWSQDGASWNNAICIPVSSLPGAGKANVNSATAAGLWMWEAPINAQYFRFNCSAFTSGNINVFLDPWVNGNTIQLPWNYTVTSGQTLVPFFDTNNIQQIVVRLSAVTTTVLTVQGTNDISGTDVFSLTGKDIGSTTSNSSATINAAGTFVFNPSGAKWARVQCTTTGTVLTVQGITAVLGAPLPASTANLNGVYVTTNNASVNLGQIAGTTTLNGGIGGSLAIGGTTGGGVNTTGVQNFQTTAQNPLTIAGINPFGQVVRNKNTDFGEVLGAGPLEWVSQFTFPTGSGTPTEGSNVKTLFIPPVEGFVDLDFSNVGTSPTFKISANFGGSLWEDVPTQRVDNTSATSTLNSQLVSYIFTPVNQSKWRAKIYGALAIRVHQTALTAGTYSTGTVRFVPTENANSGALVRGFTLGATTTSAVTGLTTQEIAGAITGAVTTTASLVTLVNPYQGGARLSLSLDGFVSTSSTGTVDLTPEGALDLQGTAWYTMQIANLGGGLYTNSYVRMSTTDVARYEVDASPFKAVRVRRSALNVATTQSNVFGAMKIAPLSKQQLLNGFGGVSGTFVTTADNQILAAQPYRKMAIIQNESSTPLFVLAVPGVASPTNYTVSLTSGDIASFSTPGAIRGIYATTAGSAHFSELL